MDTNSGPLHGILKHDHLRMHRDTLEKGETNVWAKCFDITITQSLAISGTYNKKDIRSPVDVI